MSCFDTKWICCQIGAREHYAIPRALHQNSQLGVLYTDFWAVGWAKSLAYLGKFAGIEQLRSLASRTHPALVDDSSGNIKPRIVSWNGRSLYWEAVRRCYAGRPYEGFIEVGRRFATRAVKALMKNNLLGPETVVFAYDTGALELFAWAKARGFKTVLCQMDPNRIEAALVQQEEDSWPGWALHSGQVPEDYFQRREQEWALADRIIVNSEWSRTALLQQHVPAHKLEVIPLCYESVTSHPRAQPVGQFLVSPLSFSGARPLRVLFLGQVLLRKGIQYLLRAAEILAQEPVQFDVVGPIAISAQALRTAPNNVRFHGRVQRDQAAKWYATSHVFVLPTLSDGFALTQLEAMAHGLPVVTTPNCGQVVSNGIDGFIVPPRAPEALALTFRRYLSNPALIQDQRTATLIKSRQFSISRLSASLSMFDDSLRKQSQQPGNSQ